MVDRTEYGFKCAATPAPGVTCEVPARLVPPPEDNKADPVPLCQHHEQEEMEYRDGLRL
jgi:hypothetical protein